MATKYQYFIFLRFFCEILIYELLMVSFKFYHAQPQSSNELKNIIQTSAADIITNIFPSIKFISEPPKYSQPQPKQYPSKCKKFSLS